jgi:inner membrane transporter RhtA
VRLTVLLGIVLAAMNLCFYLAIARLPLSTVGAIEFLGTVALAAAGSRTPRNMLAILLTTCGIIALTNIRLSGQPIGFAFAFANSVLFALYIILGHRIANSGTASVGGARMPGNLDRLGVAMIVSTMVMTPFGFIGALPAFTNLHLLAAGVAVGICSSVIPYVTDQVAMARLSRATFALMLGTLPLFGTLIGALVLHQIPTSQDMLGIGLVAAGVAAHRQE